MAERATARADQYDTAVIGGGPAGCSAAIAMAQRGGRVVLFEANTFPHDKLCGEFLSPECGDLLDGLGLTADLQACGPALIEEVRLSAPDGTSWQARLPGLAWGLTRRRLDAALADRARAAGVIVREATRVTGIGGSLTGGFVLAVETRAAGRSRSGTVRARTVIAAHGKRAALDRALDRRFLRQRQPFVALKAHFAGPPLPGRIELYAFSGGYCGMSEIERAAAGDGDDGHRAANVCLLVHESAIRAAAAPGPDRLPAFLRWMRSQNSRLDDWLAQAQLLDERWISVGQVPFQKKRPVVHDVLMAGDAAGLIVPLAGDGIAMALQSGQLAAQHSCDFLGGGLTADGLRRGYAAAWQREFGPRLRLGRLLQVFMLRPAWLAAGLRLLNAAPPLGRYLVANTRGSADAASRRSSA
jgi:menaquinone-9 beta-reductase